MPLLAICDCRALVETKPCPDCRRKRQARHNATPNARAHRSTAHTTITRIVKARDPHACATPSCNATDDLTIDYIIPLARGGQMHPDNARILCRSCNSSKGARVA